ncbi:HAL/PAL/TAL family ammonia-lyase [Streptomyces sp. Marseille-Q5077]|uniref:HAL/PAL/TAL family ammonia-lyase n=1 Tax=Streptomyces sp. Marseille-Q5077 TaxID=3418995 RepID=UPI003CFD6641
MTRIIIDGRTLSYDDVVAVAHHGAEVVLADEVLPRLTRERAVLEDVVDRQVPTYGLTTGLGTRSSYALPRDELEEFSVRTVRGRANAVGDPLPVPLVRAVLLARVNGIASGGSGVRPEIPRLLVAMLNARVHPVIPEVGSIGASDLCQMAHVGLVVLGEGRAEFAGQVLAGGTALRHAGLNPAGLGPKDGHVLCSASPLAAGQGALALHEAAALLTLAQAVTALTYEGFRANTSPLDARVLGLRPAPGQSRAAGELLALLDGGQLSDPRHARRVQDPISLRCAAQVHGALHAALDFADASLRPELNGCGDNPVVLPDTGEILSSGNFHTPALALAFDTLALALTQTASLSAERMRRLLDPAVSGLPANLSPYGPERSGFAPLAKTAQALVAEIRMLSVPVSTDPRHGAAAVEDDSTSGARGTAAGHDPRPATATARRGGRRCRPGRGPGRSVPPGTRTSAAAPRDPGDRAPPGRRPALRGGRRGGAPRRAGFRRRPERASQHGATKRCTPRTLLRSSGRRCPTRFLYT